MSELEIVLASLRFDEYDWQHDVFHFYILLLILLVHTRGKSHAL
jgi:hypothetical protein